MAHKILTDTEKIGPKKMRTARKKITGSENKRLRGGKIKITQITKNEKNVEIFVNFPCFRKAVFLSPPYTLLLSHIIVEVVAVVLVVVGLVED